MIDTNRDAVSGNWHLTDAGLTMDADRRGGKLMIPIMPLGRYELELKVTRTGGAEAIVAIIPVGRSGADIVLGGWHNTTSGIELINDVGAAKNDTSVNPSGLDEGRLYTVRVRVSAVGDQASISVALDGKPLTRWAGPQSALALAERWGLPNAKCLGLGVGGRTSFAFKSARLRMLSGKAVPPPKAEPPPTPPSESPPAPPPEQQSNNPNPPRGPGLPGFRSPIWGR
jgi:hypothetical protein